MVIVTHESYDSVLVGTGKQKVLSRCMKTASDGTDATWRGRSFQGAKRYWLPMSAYFFYNNISIIIMISYCYVLGSGILWLFKWKTRL